MTLLMSATKASWQATAAAMETQSAGHVNAVWGWSATKACSVKKGAKGTLNCKVIEVASRPLYAKPVCAELLLLAAA